MTNKRAKKLVLVGAVSGAALSILIALLMDALYADVLQGTWREAIAKDLSGLTGNPLTPDSFLVLAVFLIILAVLGAIGAFFGAAFAAFLYRFLRFMGNSA